MRLPTVAASPRWLLMTPHARGLRHTVPLMMPEGPEVRLHAELLDDHAAGRVLVEARIVSGRYVASAPEGWSALQAALPATVDSIRSKAKFMHWQLTSVESGKRLWLWSTLGMTGSWSLQRGAHCRAALRIVPPGEDGGAGEWLCFDDARNFGTLTVCETERRLEEKLGSLGPSWFDGAEGEAAGLELERFIDVVRRQCRTARGRAVPVVRFLMDQKKTAGVGKSGGGEGRTAALDRSPLPHASSRMPHASGRTPSSSRPPFGTRGRGRRRASSPAPPLPASLPRAATSCARRCTDPVCTRRRPAAASTRESGLRCTRRRARSALRATGPRRHAQRPSATARSSGSPCGAASSSSGWRFTDRRRRATGTA